MAAKREVLKMRITYEPNRFSSTHLMDAYEVIAPTIHRTIPAAVAPTPVKSEKPTDDAVINYKGESL